MISLLLLLIPGQPVNYLFHCEKKSDKLVASLALRLTTFFYFVTKHLGVFIDSLRIEISWREQIRYLRGILEFGNNVLTGYLRAMFILMSFINTGKHLTSKMWFLAFFKGYTFETGQVFWIKGYERNTKIVKLNILI